MKFTELPLSEQVLKGIEAAGFSDCTEVQEKILPISLAYRDVMVQSKTGSGKTAVYVLSILQKYVTAQKEGKPLPKALIVAPTRELAVQIDEDTAKLSSAIEGLTVGCFYGGVGYGKQDALIEKGCDIFVCTPGRILDYQKMHKIDFRQFDTFVVDEADRLFDMGFYPDVQKMFSLLRPAKERQTMLFSATLGTRVRNLAWSFMNSPVEVEVQPEEITVNAITQELYHISKDEKFGLLLQLLHRENPENCLVFTNTKARCIEVAKRLSLNGYASKYLMGDLPQSKRLETIDKMKDGTIKFLVATDVAARGLQIDDLQLVVNYDIPDDFESYVHRIGRTARAGKTGKSITLADEEYVFGLEPIENYIQMKIPVIWPAEGELPVVEDKSAKYSFRDLVSNDEYASSPDRGGRSRNGRPTSSPSRRSAPPRRDASGPARRGPARPAGKYAGKPASEPRVNEPRTAATKPRQPLAARPSNPAPRRKTGSKSYAEIQNLSLEERLAYYKQQYKGESGSAPASPAANRREPAQKKPVQKKTVSPVKPPVTVEKPLPKKGFFARLFGKKH
ncbi:DNA/RNA helicase, superfamily II [Sphaerochaeta pleomorpha str. Grapes]|uniref:DNA/RNA helicase, superfamily II n=1 Tax=Sphaerochaeta pleomorpha (strain ATCC BAA-1885 / DSM 22778 / Grapes) TaxID=158190 RepID=G8QSN3_SPHPG|nr:DEAD/DEAH box helicase [Sphaerochaeta pleomorpha]AEV28994.1 DNA/RNA helicase, superfamily II [Sphaerochaeta pleomorpha str. Grapes]